MTASRPDPDQLRKTIDAAREVARRAAITLALDSGASITTRPLFPGAHTTTRDVEPLAGLNAAREIELGARHAALGYLRAAREAGHSWHDIGTALHLTLDADPDQAGDTIAEAAYTYATGNPNSQTTRRYGRSFGWTCQSCDSVISDRGLCNGPADDEHGHAPSCARLAATIAALDAQWEAGQ